MSTKRGRERERARDAELALVAVGEQRRAVLRRGRRARAARAARPPRRRASRAERPAPSAATSTFSRTLSSPNSRPCWKVRASPARPRRYGGQRVMSVPPSVIVPARRQVEAGEQVDERRLAGAVGPDQAHDLSGRELEVDVRERLDALERARDAEGPKRVGPSGLRVCGRVQCASARGCISGCSGSSAPRATRGSSPCCC